MTASVLFESLGIPVQSTNDDQNTALEKLKQGEIAALVYVAGKPARLFSGVGSDTGLHLIPVAITTPLLETRRSSIMRTIRCWCRMAPRSIRLPLGP
jgi:hypothetical protein